MFPGPTRHNCGVRASSSGPEARSRRSVRLLALRQRVARRLRARFRWPLPTRRARTIGALALVASVTLSGGDEQHTFHPPYVPEWNEFYSREMHFQHDRLRIEPERIGIVIDVADHDAFLSGLPVGALVEKFLFRPVQQSM